MRPLLAATVLLAAGLATSAALAFHDPGEKVTATFESFASSVVGDVTLHQFTDPNMIGDPNLRVQLHANLKGLEPNTEYTVFLYDDPGENCGAGTSTQIL